MTINYIPHGVCSRNINVTVSDDGIIENVTFTGGCSGNTQGVSRLCEGMKVDDAIGRLENIKCGSRSTSCPAELAKALKKVYAQGEGA